MIFYPRLLLIILTYPPCVILSYFRLLHLQPFQAIVAQVILGYYTLNYFQYFQVIPHQNYLIFKKVYLLNVIISYFTLFYYQIFKLFHPTLFQAIISYVTVGCFIFQVIPSHIIHHEKIMSVATSLSSCNLILLNIFQLHQTSYKGRNFFIVHYRLFCPKLFIVILPQVIFGYFKLFPPILFYVTPPYVNLNCS